MHVIQIIGPSYCGSTVLGYSLNTVNGYFFGSEVRRLLKPDLEKLPKASACDICGKDCAYWSEGAIAHYARLTNLTEFYESFSARHEEISCFVDGSKTMVSCAGTRADDRILCVKHPIRLVASTLHNNRQHYGIAADNYFAFRDELAARDDLSEVVARVIARILATYRRFTRTFLEHVLFRTDWAHLNDFAQFRWLEHKLGLERGSIRPEAYSEFPCHSIGGNRAPLWISTGRVSIDHRSARNRFYAEAHAIGDWRIDDKFAVLLAPRVMEIIGANDDYRACMDMFGYRHEDVLDIAATQEAAASLA